MTRAQRLRSSKRKHVKLSQDLIPEYCIENSPSIQSQNSRRAALATKKSDDCKENILPKGSNINLLKSSQDTIPYHYKENSLSIFNRSSRKAAQANKKSNDCKENILPNNSKEKPVKSSPDVIPDHYKKNLSSIFNQNSIRAVQAKKKSDVCKENTSPNGLSSTSKLSSVTTVQKDFSPVRKSRRHPNRTDLIKPIKPQIERNVLSDSTNSLQAGLCRNNIFHKIIPVLQPSTSTNNNNINHKNRIPVYKTVGSPNPPNGVEPISEKKEALYEFKVDENEEPVAKKKRKKRAYIRKPKSGPKALTINNIKYSSTESLASLPEKPIRIKKKTFLPSKCSIKPCSSVPSLNNSCISVPSFMSHPTLPLQENRCELSVLQETLSEQCPTLESTLLEAPVIQTPCSSSSVPVTLSHSRHSHFSPNPRCYGSKSGRTPNPYSDDQNVVNDFLSQQLSSRTTNVSTSSLDFLSSTPCKRFSQVVRDNSVLDDSPGMRPSTGLIQDTSSLIVADDNCFGFDELEELEEPLVSPIKSSIDLKPRKILKYVPRYDWEEPKPSIQEVMELLKANIPKPAAKKETTMFVTSPQSSSSSEPTSPTVAENDVPVFVKPARRSYERQKRVQYYNSDSEEEEENIEEEIQYDPISTKEDKKCYKKANTTKTVKAPKLTKAKQRIAKEEEELEKMAALMNAQFQEIEKVHLFVE